MEPVEGVDIEGLTRSSPILSLFAERSVAIALFIWVGELEPWLMRTLEGPLGERFGGEWLGKRNGGGLDSKYQAATNKVPARNEPRLGPSFLTL